ncbi:hypothetical protein [Mucilaginibacter phyllosphaerae]
MKPNEAPDNRRLSLDTDLKLDPRYNDEAVLKQVVAIRSTLDLHPPERINDIAKEINLSVEQTVKYICRQFDFPFYPADILNTRSGKLKRDLAIQYHVIPNFG